MEKQNRVLREANEIVKKEEKKERCKRRLVKARNAVALVAVAATITAAEYAIAKPYQQQEASCYSLKIECPWPLSTPTPIISEPTHVTVPNHEVAPNVDQRVR